MSRKSEWFGRILPGLILVVLFGLFLLIPFCSQIAPKRVSDCENTKHPYGLYVRLKFEDGTQELVEISRLHRGLCLARGTLFEKRRWELGERVDGAEPVLTLNELGTLPIFGIGCLWIVLGFAYDRWKRRQ